METTTPRLRLIKPLYVSLALYLFAGALETGLIYLRGHDIISDEMMAMGKKGVILFSTLSTVILLRWLIVDTPFNFLRRYTVAPLLKSIITLLIYFGAAIVLLNRLFDISIKPLLTGSAVLTGVLALSLQETMKNFFTGLWINAERIVAKGDWIRMADKEGKVMDVTWSTTRLLSRKNNYIYIPNRLLAEGVLENYSYPVQNHVLEVDIDAGYHDPPNMVKIILTDIARDSPSVLPDPEPEVWVTTFTDFSIRYRLRVWVNDFQMVPYAKSEIQGKIWYAFRRKNVEIPFPVRVTYNRVETNVSEEDAVLYALKNIEFLRPLKDDELKRVSAFSIFEVFGAGESIVRQGDTGDTCYFIRSGSVDVVFKDEGGTERFITTLKPGDFFGEMSLLAGEPRSATVIAREDTSCLVVASQAFRNVFVENPDLAEQLSELLARRSGELKEIKNIAVSEKEKIEAEKATQKNIMKKIKRFFKME